MTSPNPQDVVAEPPRKRQKLSSSPSTTTSTTERIAAEQPVKAMDESKIQTQIVVSDNGFQPEREETVGILHFVNATNLGFSGTLKQRYVF